MYERVSSFGSGHGKVVLQDGGAGNADELFSEDFVELDPSDKFMWFMWNQCKQLGTLLTSLVKSRQLHPEEKRQIAPAYPFSGNFPKFYGLPKVHKIGTLKLRPIISCYGLYSDGLMVKLTLTTCELVASCWPRPLTSLP